MAIGSLLEGHNHFLLQDGGREDVVLDSRTGSYAAADLNRRRPQVVCHDMQSISSHTSCSLPQILSCECSSLSF